MHIWIFEFRHSDEQLAKWVQEGLKPSIEHLELGLRVNCDARLIKFIEDQLSFTERMSHQAGCIIS